MCPGNSQKIFGGLKKRHSRSHQKKIDYNLSYLIISSFINLIIVKGMWGMTKNNDVERIAEVARLYYKEGKSQAEIGKLLGVSHSTISRILKEAREQGIVEVFIRQPVQLMPSISEQLENRFRLEKAHVVYSSGYDSEENLNQLALQAAHTLADALHDGARLGISTGRTVAATIQRFNITQPIHVQVVPLHGQKEELSEPRGNLLHRLAEHLGGDVVALPAPWLMQSVEACQLITQEKSVSAALQMAEKADIGLVGIGSLHSNGSNILRNGWISQDEVEALQNAGAVGEICGVFYNQDGQPVEANLNKRVVSIRLNKLTGFKTVIGVASSKSKAQAILAALKGDLMDVLVTDSDAARELLDLAGEVE